MDILKMTIYQFQEYLIENDYIENITHSYKEILYLYNRDDIHICISQSNSDKTVYFIEIFNVNELYNFNGYEHSDYTQIYNKLIYVERNTKLNIIAAI